MNPLLQGTLESMEEASEQLESMEQGDITTNIEVHFSDLLLFIYLFCPLIPSHTLVLASQCMSDATFHGKPFPFLPILSPFHMHC